MSKRPQRSSARKSALRTSGPVAVDAESQLLSDPSDASFSVVDHEVKEVVVPTRKKRKTTSRTTHTSLDQPQAEISEKANKSAAKSAGRAKAAMEKEEDSDFKEDSTQVNGCEKRELQTKRTVRSAGRKRLNGGKEEMLMTLLGDHVDLLKAQRLRDLWKQQVMGPSADFITEYNLRHQYPVMSGTLLSHSLDSEVPPEVRSALLHPPSGAKKKVQIYWPETTDPLAVELGPYETHDSVSPDSPARSFTINTGICNRTIAWLPCSSATQYLAVGGRLENTEPVPLYQFGRGPGIVQIWQVIPSSGTRACNLKIIYHHDFGACWLLKWCPALPSETNGLAFLAGLFNDGTIRIWSVVPPEDLDTACGLRQLHDPAYTLQLPDCPCVTFDWISESRIVAGCANGMSAVWDLSSDSSIPFVVGQPHSTYVTHAIACTPSAPDVVLTTSWDCEVIMSNIHNIETDFISASRERMQVYAAAWSDYLNSAIVTEDLHSVRLVSMRTGQAVNLASMVGTVTALATHVGHPFLAMGDASGAVTIMNISRKVLSKKIDQFQRKIYQMEVATTTKQFRFTEKYQIDELLGKNDAAHSVATNIYPPELTINQLAWNMNPGFEALLASCSSEFVRIDDLASSD